MKMQKLVTLILGLSLYVMVSGCMGSQAEAKKQAVGRWSETRANVMYSMARQQFESGELDKAMGSISRAIETKDDVASYHVLAAHIYFERNKLERAFVSLDMALKLDKKHYNGHYLMGVLMQRWQKYEAALEAYNEAYKLRPDDISPLLASTEMQVKLGKVEEATKLLESKLVYFEHNSAIRTGLGRIYMLQGEYDKAIRALKQAEVLSEDDLTIQEFLVRAYQAKGMHGESIQVLNRLLAQDGYRDRDDLQLLLADSYVAIDQPEFARPIYLDYTRKYPQEPAGWMKLAEIAWAVGDTSRVIKASKKVTMLSPNRHEGYMLLGMVEAKVGRHAEAVKYYEKANRVQPTRLEPYLLKGISFEKLGEFSRAQLAYQQVLKLNPNEERAKQLLTRLQTLSKG